MVRYFEYSDEAVAHLKTKDAKLARAIDAVGRVQREMEEGDLFSSVVHHIVGQQISTAAQRTVWARMQGALGDITPKTVCDATLEELQACGITFKKAGYIKGFAEKVASGEFDLAAVERMDDAEAIAALSSLPGIGEWTAEMLLLFCLGRPDILSFGDLAIHRGMRMVYHHKKVTRAMFERYRRRYSPYGSVASLYLWAISHMDVPGYDRDFAPKAKSPR
ncbi:MAG: DNA-3-methyladenine glycosylase 2 family protein [Eggerthellaceae bacterium]|nr:DNA-3-methyladenine glycosylase 2 family protein [Eggerthellaceae bacterium]